MEAMAAEHHLAPMMSRPSITYQEVNDQVKSPSTVRHDVVFSRFELERPQELLHD
jgi:hypothetical protein